ncbi:hypothetical protein BC941DRAFT_476236 [Chlamydoabsidia padenii]|nr:hypothetical protein BC941DRAFT_476236 [Chlamydoabsidia padenii]
MRTEASYRIKDIVARKEVGLRNSGVFEQFRTFCGPAFWGSDEMHLFGHGLGKMIYGMMTNQYDNTNTTVFSFALDHINLMELVGENMEKSRRFIPSSFSGNWRDVNKNHAFYRAVDWLLLKQSIEYYTAKMKSYRKPAVALDILVEIAVTANHHD